MTFTVSAAPVILVDVLGSVAMIVLSFLCVGLARRIKRGEPENVVWTYLVWLSLGLAVFAVSRSAGHILKEAFLLAGRPDLWAAIQPASGTINSFMFILVASVTLFFERVQQINQQVIADREALKKSREQLLFLNQNLEELVRTRTRELTVSEHKYRRIFEVSRDMILVATSEGKVLECNPEARRALGLENGEPIFVQDFFADPDQWSEVEKALSREGFVQNAEAVLKRASGDTRRVLVSGGLDRGVENGGGVVHFIIRDIEQRKRMESRMAQAEKLASIGELSSGIAHEINNPLGIILGYTQLMLRSESPDSEKHEDLKTIEKHVKNCKMILEDLLAFSRGGGETRKEPADLNDLIEGTLQFMRLTPGYRNIVLEKEFAPDLPLVRVDKKKISQVVVNLLMNAAYAMENKGYIRIATRYDPEMGRVEIRVEDSGRGISREDLGRIFDPFFTTKPTGQGTGLGLSVSYGIIRNHGGDISVESTPGQGAVFHISLPVQ